MSGYAPRAPEDSVRPRHLVGVVRRPLKLVVRRMRSLALLACATVAMAASLSVHSACLPYEPAAVTLVGRIKTETFLNPSGNHERANILVLVAPICLDASRGHSDEDRMNIAATNVRKVTLVNFPADASDVLLKSDGLVRVTGTLWYTVTSHYYTRIAMNVQSVAAPSNNRWSGP